MTDHLPEREAGERAPWGFRIIVGLAVAYVVLRLVQMAGWLVDWIG